MEQSPVDRAWNTFSALMRQYPLWPATMSTCACGRAPARGAGKCCHCLTEDLQQQVGLVLAMRANHALLAVAEAWALIREEAQRRNPEDA